MAICARAAAATITRCSSAGLRLEANDLDRAADIVEALRHSPGQAPMTIPALAFHLACRRRDPNADALLTEVFEAHKTQQWNGWDLAHDLMSAALFAGLPLDRVERIADRVRRRRPDPPVDG